MRRRWPDFLLIGAARSGTTALYSCLRQHPDLFLPVRKEPHFLALGGRRAVFTGPGDDETINRATIAEAGAYTALFADAAPSARVGEASTSSLYYHEATLANIRRFLDRVPRVLAILRDPAERAFSSFQYMRSMAREPMAAFRDALEIEEERIEAGWEHLWHYRHLGYYARQLAPFFEQLGRANVHAILLEDFRRDPEGCLRRVFDFLGVDTEVSVGGGDPVNRAGRPRSSLLARAFLRPTRLRRLLFALCPPARWWRLDGRLRRFLLVSSPPPEEELQELRQGYRDDIRELETLLGRELGTWLGG